MNPVSELALPLHLGIGLPPVGRCKLDPSFESARFQTLIVKRRQRCFQLEPLLFVSLLKPLHPGDALRVERDAGARRAPLHQGGGAVQSLTPGLKAPHKRVLSRVLSSFTQRVLSSFDTLFSQTLIEVYVGSVQWDMVCSWDTVTEYHLVPVHYYLYLKRIRI